MQIEEIKVVKVQPGDTLIARVPDHIPRQAAERLRAHVLDNIDPKLRDAVKVMVLTGGASLDILRRDEVTA